MEKNSGGRRPSRQHLVEDVPYMTVLWNSLVLWVVSLCVGIVPFFIPLSTNVKKETSSDTSGETSVKMSPHLFALAHALYAFGAFAFGFFVFRMLVPVPSFIVIWTIFSLIVVLDYGLSYAVTSSESFTTSVSFLRVSNVGVLAITSAIGILTLSLFLHFLWTGRKRKEVEESLIQESNAGVANGTAFVLRRESGVVAIGPSRSRGENELRLCNAEHESNSSTFSSSASSRSPTSKSGRELTAWTQSSAQEVGSDRSQSVGDGDDTSAGQTSSKNLRTLGSVSQNHVTSISGISTVDVDSNDEHSGREGSGAHHVKSPSRNPSPVNEVRSEAPGVGNGACPDGARDGEDDGVFLPSSITNRKNEADSGPGNAVLSAMSPLPALPIRENQNGGERSSVSQSARQRDGGEDNRKRSTASYSSVIAGSHPFGERPKAAEHEENRDGANEDRAENLSSTVELETPDVGEGSESVNLISSHNFKAAIVFLFFVVLIFCYSQIFAVIFIHETSDGEGLSPAIVGLLIVVFGIPISALGEVIEPVLRRMKGGRGVGGARGGIDVVAMFTIKAYSNVFSKRLFTRVRDVTSFLTLQVVFVAVYLVIYPFRMTQLYSRLWDRARTRFLGVEPPSEPEFRAQLAIYRDRLAVKFFMLSMCQRIAASYIAITSIGLRDSYNSPFFDYGRDTLTNSEHARLMSFNGILFIVEWGVSTVLHIVILVMFKIDTIRRGGTLIHDAGVWPAIIALTAHVISDVFISSVKFDSLVNVEESEE